jgi:hypothetical protein
MRLGRDSAGTVLIAIIVITLASVALLVIQRFGWPEGVSRVAEFFVQSTALTIVLAWVVQLREERRWRGARTRERHNVVAYAAYLANDSYPISSREEGESLSATVSDLESTAQALSNNANVIDRATLHSDDPIRYLDVPLALLRLSWSAARLRDRSSLAAFVEGDVRRLVDSHRDPALATSAHALDAAFDELAAAIKNTNLLVDRNVAADTAGDEYERAIAYVEARNSNDAAELQEKTDTLLLGFVLEARAMRDLLRAVKDMLERLART